MWVPDAHGTSATTPGYRDSVVELVRPAAECGREGEGISGESGQPVYDATAHAIAEPGTLSDGELAVPSTGT